MHACLECNTLLAETDAGHFNAHILWVWLDRCYVALQVYFKHLILSHAASTATL